MAGILFLRSPDPDGIVRFYREAVGMEVWLEQGGYTLLRHGNLLIGFGKGPEAERGGLITFFYPDRSGVDAMRAAMGARAKGEPKVNDVYRIYHFYAEDPEGRALEFQAFLHPVKPHLPGDLLLAGRRSVRRFEDREVPRELLDAVFETCRFAPTSNNLQPYYYVATRDRGKISALAALRGSSSAPLARAPVAVATVGDPSRSGAFKTDAVTAAYHFLLAAWTCGLGTCWIGAMDRPEAKQALGIPAEHFVSMVTPVGFPAESPAPPPRRSSGEFVRYAD